ncbi:uncharacterized protein LOC126896311 [Daktulosphaira vitifoliae]|uniref:uncharacterized protein LOC126896311 n=1 Tax=Daktulosphaira vitifoliae TaxID=58002 RepID=UPI0021A9A5FC|nr:uncharacterized protein LOC126896311 [Daktulosphaira vitifoliae]
MSYPNQNKHTKMDDINESYCTRCVFDRLPPEMIRFIFRELSTEDLLQISATTDRLYQITQHHLYLFKGALLIRGGQDLADRFDVSRVNSLYLADVYDFENDVLKKLLAMNGRSTLDVLHIGYGTPVRYTDLPSEGLLRLLAGIKTKRVCFNNVMMTAEDVMNNVFLLDVDEDDKPPVLRCAYDRADDADVIRLMKEVESTCAGLLAEFKITIRRPATRAFAVYPKANGMNDSELPEDLQRFSVTDCAGLPASTYRQLASCRRLRRLSLKNAKNIEDDGFEAVASMPSLEHLNVDGLSNVTSDGLLNGIENLSQLRSLVLKECPYMTDDVLRRIGDLRRLRRLYLDLSDCVKVTAAGVRDMLLGCGYRLRELHLTVPQNRDYANAVNAAVMSDRSHLREFKLTFERLSFQEHQNNQPEDGWERALKNRFSRAGVHFTIQHSFTKITISVD